jgi:hypothetical protein
VKQITRYLYASPLPTCSQGTTGQATGNPNYEDLWWVPNGAESGWGVNVSHQGDILFATWFTYAADGSDLWFVMSAGQKIADRTYRGEIHRTRSAPFNAYDTTQFVPTLAGTGTFTFTDNNNGTFEFTIDGQTRTKTITRYVFSSPPTVCVFPTSQSTMPPPYGGPYGP